MKKNNKICLPNYDPPLPLPPIPRHTHIMGKIMGFVDFKMAANENALTQPKFELGISAIIHNVFQGD